MNGRATVISTTPTLQVLQHGASRTVTATRLTSSTYVPIIGDEVIVMILDDGHLVVADKHGYTP